MVRSGVIAHAPLLGGWDLIDFIEYESESMRVTKGFKVTSIRGRFSGNKNASESRGGLNHFERMSWWVKPR